MIDIFFLSRFSEVFYSNVKGIVTYQMRFEYHLTCSWLETLLKIALSVIHYLNSCFCLFEKEYPLRKRNIMQSSAANKMSKIILYFCIIFQFSKGCLINILNLWQEAMENSICSLCKREAGKSHNWVIPCEKLTSS